MSDDPRFWKEITPEWRKTLDYEGRKSRATGLVFMKYPIYESPALCGNLLRPMKERLFNRPWKPFKKYDRYDLPQWIFAHLETHPVLEVVLVSPSEAEKLQSRFRDLTVWVD